MVYKTIALPTELRRLSFYCLFIIIIVALNVFEINIRLYYAAILFKRRDTALLPAVLSAALCIHTSKCRMSLAISL